MALVPVSVGGDTNDIPGVAGYLVAPMVPAIPLSTRTFAMGRPINTLGSILPMHGNPFDPEAPGYNPPCAQATITGQIVPNIIVEGKPLALAGTGVGSFFSCGHWVLGPGAVTVLASAAPGGGPGREQDYSPNMQEYGI